jgi:hypothetical protein
VHAPRQRDGSRFRGYFQLTATGTRPVMRALAWPRPAAATCSSARSLHPLRAFALRRALRRALRGLCGRRERREERAGRVLAAEHRGHLGGAACGRVPSLVEQPSSRERPAELRDEASVLASTQQEGPLLKSGDPGDDGEPQTAAGRRARTGRVYLLGPL